VLCAAVLLGGCVQAAQIYPLTLSQEQGNSARGSVQVERIEGDQRLLAIQLEGVPGPESWGAASTCFMAWAEDSRGHTVKVGPLSYDRARRSARLLGVVRGVRHPEDGDGIDFQAFTVKVTAEREAGVKVPSKVLLGERRVTNQ
jgi:hypothetical protein